MLIFSCTEDIKSCSRSSSSSSSQEESDAEATKDAGEDETAEQPEEVHQDEEKIVVSEADGTSPDEQDEPNPEEPAATETESAFPKDSDLQDSAGDSTEINISDTSAPSGTENKQSDDTSVDKEAESMVDEIKQEEEQERGEYKSADAAVEFFT